MLKLKAAVQENDLQRVFHYAEELTGLADKTDAA
jgi:hypothetical protein